MDAWKIPYAGELAALAASLIWACSISIYRAQGVGVPAQTLNLYKLFVALIGYTLIILVGRVAYFQGWINGDIPFPATSEKTGLLMLTGVIGFTISDTLFFAAIHRLGAQLTAALQCLTPPINELIDLWLYPNRALEPLQVVGMAVTLTAVAGVIFSGSPIAGLKMGSRGWWWGVFFAVACAVIQAVSYAMIHLLLDGESIMAVTLVRIAPAFLILLAFGALTRPGRAGLRIITGSRRRLRWLTLASILGTIVGLTLLTFGLQNAKTGIVSTLSGTYPIWLIPVASIFLREHPKPLQIICTVLAVLGIAMLAIPNELSVVWQRVTSELWF